MAQIKAFASIRPAKGLEDKIAALPYDVYNRQEAKAEVAKQPLSFLQIDRAESLLDDSIDTYDDRVYQKAQDTLWKMIEGGQFVKEDQPCYYVYELTMNRRVQTGLVACASIDDYTNNVIKKHENTRVEKEMDRIRHVDCCGAQTGPIFLAYRAQERINEIVTNTKKMESVYDFVAPDDVTHRVWVIRDTSLICEIEKEFEKVEQIYIADGHHRAASAVKVGLKRREACTTYSGMEPFNFFLSVLFPDEELMIMDYNRVVKDLNGENPSSFVEKVKQHFQVQLLEGGVKAPENKGQIVMYLDKQWYLLTSLHQTNCKNPVEGLDVTLLQTYILDPILGIQNPKTDERIDFVGGIRGYEELERRVNSDCKVAFGMYPTSIEELFQVSDAGLLMPPKSTWFEPKLRSGLFIHEI